jgi:hypothetical protein
VTAGDLIEALAAALDFDPDRRVWHRAALVSGTHEELASELEVAGARARRRGAIDVAVTALRRAAQLSDPATGPGVGPAASRRWCRDGADRPSKLRKLTAEVLPLPREWRSTGAMSEPTHFYDDDDEPEPRRGGSKTVVKTVAGVAVVAVVGFGATNALSKNTSSSSKSTSSAPTAKTAGGYGVPGRGALGTQVTGDTLSKLKAAVAAKYPGTVEQAVKLQDGSYEVHVIGSTGTETHVLVSKDFKITGTQQGGPPAGAGQSAPSTASHA